MKIYIKRYINNQTGLADYIQTSTLPTHDHISLDNIKEQIKVVIPGQPPIPQLKYSVEELEVEETESLRARDYLNILNKSKAEQYADKRFVEKKRLPLRDIIKKDK